MTYAELFESILEPEIEDADEETFWLYSQPHPSSDLGFVDPRAASVEVCVGGADFTVHQSPGVLSSDRAGGTTGAGPLPRLHYPPRTIANQTPSPVLWKISPMFADWLAGPSNFLFSAGLLGAASAVLELGCGVSPLNALALAPRVASHTLTDQAYVRRLIRRNIDHNTTGRGDKAPAGTKRWPAAVVGGRIAFETLDWETDAPPAVPGGFDAVLAVDCVYNAALIPPLVQTCADACRLREKEEGEGRARSSLCIVAQQLRDDDVFRAWLAAFAEVFRVWRVPDEKLPETLRPSAGFAVHIGILRA